LTLALQKNFSKRPGGDTERLCWEAAAGRRVVSQSLVAEPFEVETPCSTIFAELTNESTNEKTYSAENLP